MRRSADPGRPDAARAPARRLVSDRLAGATISRQIPSAGGRGEWGDARQPRPRRAAHPPRARRAVAPGRPRRARPVRDRGLVGARRAGAVRGGDGGGLRTLRARRRVGPPVGHDLVPVHGHGAGGLGGRRGRGRDRPRLPVRRRRLPGRGPGLDRRRPPAGRPSPPDRGAPAGREGRRAGGGRARGGGQPVVPLVPALTDGLARHRAGRTALPPPPGRPGRPRPHGLRPRPRRRGAGRDHARPPAGRPPPGPPAADAGAGLRRARPRRRRRHRGAGAGGARPGARPAGPGERAHDGRRRPRAHRHRVAVAAAGDGPQVHAHLRVGGPAHGRRARLPVRLLAGGAAGVDARPPSRPLRPHAGEGRRRAVDPGRRHVGRGRHEPAERRVDRAPARPRSAVLRGALRPALPRGLDPGRLRLPRLAPAALRGRRLHPLRHAEAVVEQGEPLPPQHVLVGGHRRDAGADPLPPGRDVQRGDGAGRAGPVGAAVPRARLERLVADALRLRRRRRRADPGDGRPGPAHGRPRRPSPPRAGHGRRVLRLRRGRGRGGRPRPDLAGRAVLRDAPGHADEPDPDEAREPDAASACSTRPSCGGPASSARRSGPRPWRPSSTSCGRTCSSSSSTTSSPGRRSPGSTPTPRPSTHGSPTAWRR